MTSRDFCFWLQGFFELGNTAGGLNPEQVATVQRHLTLVFKHEIDPSMGGPKEQAELNETHKPPLSPSHTWGGPSAPGGPVLRC